jgi:hypothetical protein
MSHSKEYGGKRNAWRRVVTLHVNKERSKEQQKDRSVWKCKALNGAQSYL